MDRVAITGMGVCSHLGDDLEAVGAMLRAGRTRPLVRWEEAAAIGCGCTLIGRYDGDVSNEALGIDRTQARFMGRAARLGLKAARAAVAMAGIDPRRVEGSGAAVVIGSGTGDVETHVAIDAHLRATGRARGVGPYTIPRLMASSVGANVATILGACGPSVSASAACAGGAWNLAIAAMLIETGAVDVAIAGGVEVADLHFHVGFDEMRAYTRKDEDAPERASRPYAADRNGFVFGEGAGVLVLERESRASARGAEVLGVLAGWGMSSDGAGDMVKPSIEGPKRAIVAALRKAEIHPDAIDYVNTHATGTAGDLVEVEALRDLFARHLPYSSTKGYTGHTVSGAGAIEAIFTVMMMRGGWIAPSAHAEPVDPAIEGFAPVTRPTDASIAIALSNSFGFGGTNAALVLAR